MEFCGFATEGIFLGIVKFMDLIVGHCALYVNSIFVDVGIKGKSWNS